MQALFPVNAGWTLAIPQLVRMTMTRPCQPLYIPVTRPLKVRHRPSPSTWSYRRGLLLGHPSSTTPTTVMRATITSSTHLASSSTQPNSCPRRPPPPSWSRCVSWSRRVTRPSSASLIPWRRRPWWRRSRRHLSYRRCRRPGEERVSCEGRILKWDSRTSSSVLSWAGDTLER